VLVDIIVRSANRAQVIDITAKVREIVDRSPTDEGFCTVIAPHTTASIIINEAYDPSVAADLLARLDKMVPWEGDYSHAEGNAAAHIKAALLGSTVLAPIHEGKLMLGTWQGILFVDFDGPRQRQLWVQITGE
jgi:secondary thiamine-phosphate synthase enzyme